MTQLGKQVFGWQGLTLTTPEDWALVGFGGDEKAGSCRIDAGEPDRSGAPSGIELRWSTTKGKQTEATLETRIKPLLQSVERTAKRAKHAVQTRIKAMKMPDHPERDAALSFSWSSDQAGRGRIWHCTVCGRTTVVQVYGGSDNTVAPLANDLLASIACHGRPGWRTWGLYGLLVELPDDFKLMTQQLMNVYLLLRFQRGRSQDQMVVEQWSLANVQLKGAYLDEWYDRKSSGWTDGVRSVKQESSVHDHAALRISGRRNTIGYLLLEASRQIARFRKPALEYDALLWECPESNKAYLIQAFTRRLEPDLIQSCADRTECHPGATAKIDELVR